jgi:hypothetical protein
MVREAGGVYVVVPTSGRLEIITVIWVSSVCATRAKSHPLETTPAAGGPALLFRTGETIKESGIYRVYHNQHRLPHEVTLLQGQQFPRCAKCDDAVMFELVQPAFFERAPNRLQLRIYLYELPVLDGDAE